MSPFILYLMQFTILAYALVGGVFLAFSDFIMRSLSVTGGVGGVEAMQAINREVFRWIFMTLFLGMAAVSVLLTIYAAMNLGGSARMVIIAACLVYLFGRFGVTVFFNVPLNETLAGMDLTLDTTRNYWAGTYLPHWTFWNTVRTIACALAAALLLYGLPWVTGTQAI